MVPFPQIALTPMLSGFGGAAFGLSVGEGAVWVLIAVLVASVLGIVHEAMADRKTSVHKPALRRIRHLPNLDAKQPNAA